MRKKSHISLAKFLVNDMKVRDLHEHKKAFYIGSILPDLKPSFFTKKHTIDETFDILIEEIKKITIDYDVNKGINRYFARHLGVITHYLADYCTFPHNSIFQGTMTDHVYYEKDLKYSLKEYVKSPSAGRSRTTGTVFVTVDEIIQMITKIHTEYLKAKKAVKEDIRYIVELCHKVVDAVLQFFETAHNSHTNKMQIAVG
ncbi:zinc dependent phospholipase C family protein [Mobilitalea sibirica]|uniref:Zinc dependent phospholipase C family protein n=1 Tax=Mobilitalea sibirica TaxID=1462919 RepID=A0A8J7L2I0_9FIRM|nr:zinc dependent phospholipase C family protein [Mobilitalea sibirica]MBH1940658.1 zinc dependent phospholipase C family protein [Mobilitalea sibirica]